MSVKSSDAAATRDRLPFKVIDADGQATNCATLELVRDQPGSS